MYFYFFSPRANAFYAKVAGTLHNLTFSYSETSKSPGVQVINRGKNVAILAREVKLTPKLVHARLTGCRDYGLHGCFTFLDINSRYIHIYIHIDDRDGDLLISWRVRRVTARTIPAIPTSLIVTCFLPFSSFSLRFQLRILCVFSFYLSLYIRAMLPSPISNSNTGNRKADRNPTPWELAIRVSIWNAKLYGCSRRNDHVAFRLR